MRQFYAFALCYSLHSSGGLVSSAFHLGSPSLGSPLQRVIAFAGPAAAPASPQYRDGQDEGEGGGEGEEGEDGKFLMGQAGRPAGPLLAVGGGAANIPKGVNYYQVLGVSTFASESEVKAAYRKLVWSLHPDRNPENVLESREMFEMAAEAYRVLSDPRAKSTYDQGIVLRTIAFGTADVAFRLIKITVKAAVASFDAISKPRSEDLSAREAVEEESLVEAKDDEDDLTAAKSLFVEVDIASQQPPLTTDEEAPAEQATELIYAAGGAGKAEGGEMGEWEFDAQDLLESLSPEELKSSYDECVLKEKELRRAAQESKIDVAAANRELAAVEDAKSVSDRVLDNALAAFDASSFAEEAAEKSLVDAEVGKSNVAAAEMNLATAEATLTAAREAVSKARENLLEAQRQLATARRDARGSGIYAFYGEGESVEAARLSIERAARRRLRRQQAVDEARLRAANACVLVDSTRSERNRAMRRAEELDIQHAQEIEKLHILEEELDRYGRESSL